MANNPVQIVLNDSAYIRPADPGRGGPRTDFYAGNDAAFIKHKGAILQQANALGAQLSNTTFGKAIYARVRLREDALAKSHRPNRVLFDFNSFPCVGAGALGELYYFVDTDSFQKLIAQISSAENSTTWRTGPAGKRYASPSDARSEVGAIKEVGFLPPSEKRDFNVDTAMSWLSEVGTDGSYVIELFERPAGADSRPRQSRANLFASLSSLLLNLGMGADATMLAPLGETQLLTLRLAEAGVPARLSTFGEIEPQPPRTLDRNPARHQQVLERLAEHPLVRHISLPLKLELSASPPHTLGVAAKLAIRRDDGAYPTVGVIDTGVADPLSSWVKARHDFLAKTDCDPAHGTFIGGLLTHAQSLNGTEIGREMDGCNLVDIPLFPKGPFLNTYRGGFVDFLEEVEQAVIDAKTNHGTRIFNLSINAVSPVDSDRYSYYAHRLDMIARQHEVIFVNSVGNLPYTEKRAPWPAKPTAVLKYFASRTEPDTLHKPSESVEAISVGAINPPNMTPHLFGTPTTYTRRGPGLRVGSKPDLAHYGGSEGVGTPAHHGLISIDASGISASNAGTSFAAPLVSKTLATLDSRIATPLPTHSLKALLIHNAVAPDSLSSKRVADLTRQFIGFGIPISADAMLETDDSSITMLFSSHLPNDIKRPKILRFPFPWPQSLVDANTGACTGSVRMTLVYVPPLDPSFGTEFVRVNLDAKLQQRQPADRKDGKPSFTSQIDQCFLPKTANQPAYEQELIRQGLKWWPTKRYERILPVEGNGSSSEWRLEVSSLTRSEADFPATGIPFTVILTISDPEGTRPIFQELRRTLQARNVNFADIRTGTRIQVRP